MSKSFSYIDIHGHVNFAAYDSDREDVISRARESGVAMITVGTNFETSSSALESARAHEGMYAVVGLHPVHTSASHHDVAELGESGSESARRGEVADVSAYSLIAADPKVVGIGECGLDYYRLEGDSVNSQRREFEKMIDLANDVKKPLMLHIRNGSGTSAYRDAYDILKSRSHVRGNLHFFAGSIDEAKPFLDLGYTFSFTGVLTFAQSYDDVVRYLPLDRIMSETDCPYVSPKPFRGKRNEPQNVIEVVKAIARIRECDADAVTRQIMANAREFFSLPL